MVLEFSLTQFSGAPVKRSVPVLKVAIVACVKLCALGVNQDVALTLLLTHVAEITCDKDFILFGSWLLCRTLVHLLFIFGMTIFYSFRLI